MNILPFVFTLLLLLTFLTSFMFTSTIRTTREKKIVLTEHQAYLLLLSKQNKDRFNKSTFAKKEKSTSRLPSSSEKTRDRQKKFAEDSGQEFRDVRMGYEGGKVNLWLMIHGEKSPLQSKLQKTVIQLIEILYGSYPFYKTGGKKNIAQEIVQAMIDQKIETFEQLQFKDPKIDAIFYTMMKGTNTGYPPLTEYCRLIKNSDPPIHFRFTSKPVIRAALGEKLSQLVFSLERENHAKNKKVHALKKEALIELVNRHPTPDMPPDLLTELFCFKSENKGLPQLSFQKNVKIRAFHEAKIEKTTP